MWKKYFAVLQQYDSKTNWPSFSPEELGTALKALSLKKYYFLLALLPTGFDKGYI